MSYHKRSFSAKKAKSIRELKVLMKQLTSNCQLACLVHSLSSWLNKCSLETTKYLWVIEEPSPLDTHHTMTSTTIPAIEIEDSTKTILCRLATTTDFFSEPHHSKDVCECKLTLFPLC
jgi:hypothetical protein